MIKDHPKLLSSPDLLKLNRCVSYMTFIIKEIYDYYSLKTSDGTLVFKLRKAKANIQKLKEEAEKVQGLLV